LVESFSKIQKLLNGVQWADIENDTASWWLKTDPHQGFVKEDGRNAIS
jgi:hypothetical protein